MKLDFNSRQAQQILRLNSSQIPDNTWTVPSVYPVCDIILNDSSPLILCILEDYPVSGNLLSALS